MARTSRSGKIGRRSGEVWRWFGALRREQQIGVVAALVGTIVGVGAICRGVYKGIAGIIPSRVSTTDVSETVGPNSADTKDATPQTETMQEKDSVAAGNQKRVVRIVEKPANIVLLSIPEAAARWVDDEKTLVERQQFAKEYANRPVRWEARLTRFSLSEHDDPNSPIFAQVRPLESKLGSAIDTVLVDFLPECTHDFLFLKRGDLIEFQGRLDFSSVMGYLRVRDATLLSYVRE